VLRASLATLMAATLIAAGCGGSSKSGTESTSASTAPASTTSSATNTSPSPPASGTSTIAQTQWATKADAICARVNAEMASNPVKGKTKSFAVVVPQIAAVERTEVSELGKLVPPAAKAQDWQRILSDAKQRAEATAELGKLAQTGNFNLSSPIIKKTTVAYTDMMNIARRDGLVHCGENTP
jgi:hypothetical protein